ncbi:MAG: periplasmic heavy metal sensor [Planctomycetota bacterium]|nr:MAG: periplasmic heavy metal sensor [Planctomycetota bacterium]
MRPKALVACACALNLLAGVALGLALDRAILRPPQPAAGPRSTAEPAFDRRRGADTRGRRWGHGPHRRGGRARFLAEALGLDPEQSAKLRAVFESRRKRMRAVFAKVRPELEALEEELHAEIRALLRPEQVARFDALRADFEARRRRWRRGNRAGPRPSDDGVAPAGSASRGEAPR